MKKSYRKELSEIKRKHDEINKINFFDVQIYGGDSTILPAHRYVLGSRSELLAEELASDVNVLNWTVFKEKTCIAVLRWIYTNELVFEDATAEQWLDLLQASSDFHLVSLLETCERKLLSLVTVETSQVFCVVAKKVGANQLLDKCLELSVDAPDISPDKLEEESDDLEEESDDLEEESDDLEEELGELEEESGELQEESDEESDEEETDWFMDEFVQTNKLTLGYYEFQQFSDTTVYIGNDTWQAHAHVLGIRSKKLLTDLKTTNDVRGRTICPLNFSGIYFHARPFLRWLYTDCVELEGNGVMESLLEAAQYYELPTLFERCEIAIIEKVDITLLAYYHDIAVKSNATKMLKRCNELISQYFNKAKSPDSLALDVEMESDNSLSEMLICQDEGLLMLNDDCLLHLFRFVSTVDLGSIRATCKRLSSLAEQSFRLYRDKSLKICCSSMFADIWMLKHFGKFIESLILDSFYERYASRENIVAMIGQFTGEQLKSISFNDFDKSENDETLEPLQTVLKNVECIEFTWFNYDSNINSLLGYCENLNEVKIDGELMKLNTDWCSKNRNVTKLTVCGLQDDTILEEICKKLTRLECLSIDCIDEPTNKIIHLSRLSHLKKLRIEASRVDVARALHQFGIKTVLEHLCLCFAKVTEALASVLGDFPNLSTLVFENCYGFDENTQNILSKRLVSVQRLTFKENEEITFEAITNIVKNLLELKTLVVTECGNIEFIDRNSYQSLRKKRNLQILLDKYVHHRTCELIGKNLSDYVKIQPIYSPINTI